MRVLHDRLQGISNSVARLPTHRRRLENVMKNLQAYAAEMSGSGRSRDKSKSIKKGKSFNFRSLIREGSNRFNPTVVATAEKSESPEKEITPTVDQVV